MKKIISALLVIMMLIPPSFVMNVAAEENYGVGAGLLKALGIVNEEYDPEAPITKYEATVISMKLIGKAAANYAYNGEFSDVAADAPEAGLVLEAVKNNIVSSAEGNVFAKNSAITYNAAIKLILNALDFSVFANVGQIADYVKFAKEFNLDIKVKNSKSISVVEFYEMAAIALDIPLVEIQAIKQGNPVYEINKNINVLEKYFDVYKTTGYIESNGVTALYSKNCSEDMLRINGIDVKYSNLPGIDSLLGMEVDLYYKNSDYPEYVYHTQLESQKILKIGSDDIQQFLNNVYTYDNGNGSNKKVRILDNCAIIYNGMAVTEEDSKYISNALFVPENGYVELLSDSSGKYKTVKIYNFDTYVVKNVYSDNSSKMLVDKYGKKNLTITDDAFLTVRDKDNNVITFDNIENGDVLSVACSFDGECVQIYASGDAVEGIFTARCEDVVTIEGEDFILSRQLQKDESRIPAIGENVTVYLDSFDRVVAIEMRPESVWSLGLVLKTGTEREGLCTRAGCVILTAEGTVETLYAAETFWIDAKKYTEAEKFADTLKLNEVIRYKLNKDGQLFRIDTAQEVESNNTLQPVGTAGSYTWRNTNSLLYTSDGSVIPVKSDATVFVNPEFVTFAASGSKAENAEFYDKDYFTSGTSFLTNGIVYNIKAYKTNSDSMLADIILCGFYNYDLYMRTEQTYVVNKVLTTLDEDGNKLIKLKCNGISGEKEMWDYKDRADNVYTNSIRTLKDIKPGDIVRADLANDGRVLFIFKIFDYNNRWFYQRIYSSNVASVETSGTLPKYTGAKPGEYNNYADREYYVYGDALEFADGYIRVRPCGGTRDIIFKSADNVIIYEKNNVRRGSMSDIRFDETGIDSDKIIVAAYLTGIQTVVVFK